MPECPLASDVIDASDPKSSLPALVGEVKQRWCAVEVVGDVDLRERAGALRRAQGALPADVALEGCALAAEATRRELSVTLHDEQLAAAVAMACGWTVQVRTGEGKTFAALGPTAVAGLWLGSAHVVTANPYLARRDAAWVGGVLERLGLRVGVTTPGQDRAATRDAYAGEVTFGAAMDFGFDLLRDQLALPGDEPVQRCRAFALIDEADAVLLDQATMPLVLSGPSPATPAMIEAADAAVAQLDPVRHIEVDTALRTVALTEPGIHAMERLLRVDNLYDVVETVWPHLVGNALRGRVLLRRDHDYVVSKAEGVQVVDETTGRIQPGRRWSDGLHQAVEAKEGVPVSQERRPLGRTTTAGYFGGYDHVVGMSGTFTGAEAELARRLGLRVVAIPTHRPVVRVDQEDLACTDESERLRAVVDDVASRRLTGQPVLVGTTSIGQSHQVSRALAEAQVPHAVLTAQNDHEEAELIALAGGAGTVTVATQMAGRGVDIRLDDAARRAGGLMVWGFERHMTQRLDDQLRGRAGRQGDPGASRFAVAPGDTLFELREHPDDHIDECQRRAEELEAGARFDSLALDDVLDRAHRGVARLRRGWWDDPLEPELETAAAVAAAAVVDRGVDLPWVAPACPGRSRRRRLAIEAHVIERVAGRRRELGADFDPAARLVLHTLSIALWADLLDDLDLARSMHVIGASFRQRQQQWLAEVARAHELALAHMRVEWLFQLVCLRVACEAPLSAATLVPTIDLPRPAGDVIETREWTGWSFNRFVRRHFGMPIPDPPVVLTIDAVGRPPEHAGLSLHLDRDDPHETVLVRADR
jgi:preprotein translocase subunit SecA